MAERHYDVARLQEDFEKHFSPWVRDLDIRIERIDSDRLHLTMQPATRLNRAGDIVSGQALMAAADTAMVLAVFAVADEFTPCATVDMTTSFLKPATNVTLDIEAIVVRVGRTLSFTRCEISSRADGKAVATATATYAMPPKKS